MSAHTPSATRYALHIFMRKLSTSRQPDALQYAASVQAWLRQYETNKLIGSV